MAEESERKWGGGGGEPVGLAPGLLLPQNTISR